MSKLDLERWGRGLAHAFPVETESVLSRLLLALDAIPWPPPAGSASEEQGRG